MEIFSNISTFAFDMDGVLTDGTLFLLPDGEMLRRMSIKDGYALQLAVKKGYKVVVISGSSSEPVKKRLEKLGVTDVFMHVEDKKAALLDYLDNHGLKAENAMFMGDDVPDLEVMLSVGLPCCPADACTQVLAISTYVSPVNGGLGCARDIIEKVMTAQNRWRHDVSIASR